ncbi:hypothetical protein CEP54_015651 [Fusarium duplospermum]|uniref:Uncharacterized protein n=1 Tax=Fusarium duplospermum TaxID=1325734 RepID=A0A428NMJ3_9HYPO|nr:hypothetical protein CEP54_015651 [Fusarium duplospermum]
MIEVLAISQATNDYITLLTFSIYHEVPFMYLLEDGGHVGPAFLFIYAFAPLTLVILFILFVILTTRDDSITNKSLSLPNIIGPEILQRPKLASAQLSACDVSSSGDLRLMLEARITVIVNKFTMRVNDHN